MKQSNRKKGVWVKGVLEQYRISTGTVQMVQRSSIDLSTINDVCLHKAKRTE